MSEFLNSCGEVLKEIYRLIYGGGYIGCGVAFVISVVMLNWGLRITGREETFTGSISFGIANLRRNPAIEGTAKNWFDRLTGYLMQLGDAILMTITFFAFASLLLVELSKQHR